MNGKTRRLPIGIQDFETLRQDGFLYVDKTAFLYELCHGAGRQFFLSRPRRFGKSLLLSMFRSFWEGKKELFASLAIETLETDFTPHPVFYFDLNRENYLEPDALSSMLDKHLRDWEKIWGRDHADRTLAERFQSLLTSSVRQTGHRAVVLVDEYDKPLLETLDHTELFEQNRAIFKGFFNTLKSEDRSIRFAFLTGVTKFSQVSIFSDLNHLVDLSMDRRFASICGITEKELRQDLAAEAEAMARARKISLEDCYRELKDSYDGYHFHPESEGIYNPFSLLNALEHRETGYYWFSTGTPSFLVRKLRTTGIDIRTFTDDSLYTEPERLSDYHAEGNDLLPLLYQSGYLTITGYEKEYRSCRLGYPNREVRYGFLKSLAPTYLYLEDDPSALSLATFQNDLRSADLEDLRDRFTALFARLPYPQGENAVERDFQNVVYLVFLLLGQNVRTEVHSARGRADCIVETSQHIYIFEFKRDASAEEALEQIEQSGYAAPYVADRRSIHKIGANFDSKTGTLSGWLYHTSPAH